MSSMTCSFPTTEFNAAMTGDSADMCGDVTPTRKQLSQHYEMRFEQYAGEHQLPAMTRLIEADLSEPYSIYTYRYFLHSYPELCFLAMDQDDLVGVIICKIDIHKQRQRGYIGMLAVSKSHRKQGVGSRLVTLAIQEMANRSVDEVIMETEVTNCGAIGLYEHLGFVRDKRLKRYYLNGIDAFRLKLWLK